MLSISRISFLSLCISNILFSTESCIKSQDNNDKPNIQIHCSAHTSEGNKKDLKKELEKQSGFAEKTDALSKEEIEEMKKIFNSCPIEAQFIPLHLIDPLPAHKNYRAAYFIGKPGTGKTTMTKIIAYAMVEKGWACKRLSVSNLLERHPHQTSLYLEDQLKTAIASGKPTLIIIDGLDHLLSNYNRNHLGGDLRSATLLNFLDEQKNNERFFFIGTMNHTHCLPESFQDRILYNTIEFPKLTRQAEESILRGHFLAAQAQLSPEITDDFLRTELAKMHTCSNGTLKNMCEFICREQAIKRDDISSPLIIEKSFITKAINKKMPRTDSNRDPRNHR